ncbi:outer envelope pore protein 21, chloroplastic isoform X2 [Selaginella moellendorffii]|uniref:outer envelope pore protein 21, chloroplastic isoform X2 n=1 Tax=Selaginella moellendorffii TaxID=88036 RepID=UPI000D1CF9D0|nr:outer envelope pore protein 21, chloroplastic isoform X2 [Selaginella moellendorffii]XP_024531551.1 outer envelope pore protein 21, chloroplastic isoform X2 [Selaginella moellendorffii]|eukprot:XP_024530071.1 outer envelope pore protein 21, chloroplastic isoform X2 [Selaginella moellendorffii]
METSLRFRGDERQLRLHAKENFLLDSSFCLQVHGYLNTHNGRAGCIAQLKRKFLPELLTSLDVGARYDTDHKEFTYDVRGKKTLPLTDNGLLSVDLKGGFNFNPRLKLGKARGAIELSYKVFNFTEDQDLKLKIGYDPFKQKPYLQLRENNWTFNADINGAWNIIYDL